MHWTISSASLLAAAVSSLASAQDREVRTVQLISMIQPETPQSIAPVSLSKDGTLTAAHSFWLYDLSRRWMHDQMAQGLRQTAPLFKAPEPDLTPTSYVTEQLAIPAWMRDDKLRSISSSTSLPGCQTVNYRPTGFLKQDAERRRERYFALMSGAACESGVPVGLFDAMIIQESQYDPLALSSKRAFGLSQLISGTAASLGVDRFDVGDNLRGGARYLRAHLDRFGRYDLALAAYNAGPGRIRNGKVPAITETRSYVRNILDYWLRLSAAATNEKLTSHPNPSEANRRAYLIHFHNSY